MRDISCIANLSNLESLDLRYNEQVQQEFQQLIENNKREVELLLTQFKQTEQYRLYKIKQQAQKSNAPQTTTIEGKTNEIEQQPYQQEPQGTISGETCNSQEQQPIQQQNENVKQQIDSQIDEMQQMISGMQHYDNLLLQDVQKEKDQKIQKYEAIQCNLKDRITQQINFNQNVNKMLETLIYNPFNTK